MLLRTRCSAFTVIELLIVVVIMAVLVGTIVPQFSTSANNAQVREMKVHLQLLRTELEFYKLHHRGNYPDGSNNLEQLTRATDAAGATSTTGSPDADHPYGPYVRGGSLPVQPFSGSSAVQLDRRATGMVPTATAAPGGGWIYRPASGEIWIDHPDYSSQ